MPAPFVNILDTTASETGNTQTVSDSYTKSDIYNTIAVYVGSGDTVVVEGKVDASQDFIVVNTYTESTLTQIRLPRVFRARRTVDGGVGESLAQVQNNYNLPLTSS